MIEKIQYYWDKVQDLFDISGDFWMTLFTTMILLRVYMVLRGGPSLNMSEASVYSSAVLAFSYANRGGPKT